MINNKYAVLLVDDSADDRLFMRLALERSNLLTVTGEVSDGQEAIDYLKGDRPFQDRMAHPWPDILLVDLKMPRKNGFDVLEWVRSESSIKVVIAIVSGASLAEDVARSLALGAKAYFKKASSRHEQEEMIRAIEGLVKQQN